MAARAAVLGVKTDTAALRILRQYIDGDGKVFDISSTAHPARRFTVSQRMRRMHDGA